MSSGRSIFVLLGFNILSAVVSMAVSSAMVYAFGTSRAVEVFFAASSLQTLILSLAQTGQLNEVLIPLYNRLKTGFDRKTAYSAFAIVTNWMVLSLAIVALLGALVAPWIMRVTAPGFSVEDQAQAASMFCWLAPLLPLQVFDSLMYRLANAEKQFGRPEFFGVFSRIVNLLLIVALFRPLGSWVLVVAAWLSELVAFAGSIYITWQMGYRHRWVWKSEQISMKMIYSQLFHTMNYMGATQLYTVVFNASLTLLPQGTYAVFRYVATIIGRVDGWIQRPVVLVFFSHFSEAVEANDSQKSTLLDVAVERMLLISMLKNCAVMVVGQNILAFLWRGKDFSQDSLALATLLWVAWSWLLFPSGYRQLLGKVLVSFGYLARLYWMMAFVQILSAGLSYWAPREFGFWGAVGALVFNALALACGCWILLATQSKHTFTHMFPWRSTWKWMLAVAIAVALGHLSLKLFGANVTPWGRIHQLIVGGVVGMFTVTVAWGAACLFGISEARLIVGHVWNKLRELFGSAAKLPSGTQGGQLEK